MSVRTLLETLGHGGVILTAEYSGLRYRAPVGVVTARLKSELRAHKAELVRLLLRRCPFCNQKVGTVTSPATRDQLFYLDTNCASCGELIECVVPARQELAMDLLSESLSDPVGHRM